MFNEKKESGNMDNAILSVLLSKNSEEIERVLKSKGYEQSNFPVWDFTKTSDDDDNDEYTVTRPKEAGFACTIGMTSYGEDVFSKSLATRIEAEKYSAVKTLLGHDIIKID